MDINDITPLYRQLKQTLLDKIRTGEWPAGVKISTEMELCEQFGMSRITVRQALSELSNEGFIIRKQGRGTFVSLPKVSTKLSSFYSFSKELIKQGYRQHDKILSFDKIEASDQIAKQLLVTKRCPLFIIERLRFINQDPFVFETSYLPVHLCPALTMDTIIEEDGLYNALKQVANIEPDAAEEEFEAVNTPANVASLLHISRNAPTILIKRIARMDQNIFEYCTSYLRSDIYKFTIYMKK